MFQKDSPAQCRGESRRRWGMESSIRSDSEVRMEETELLQQSLEKEGGPRGRAVWA